LHRLDEIKTLLARVAKHSASSLNRRDALTRLEQACVGQRTLTDFFKKPSNAAAGGGGSSERLVQELSIVLSPSFSARDSLLACGGRDGGAGGGGGGEVLLVKIEESGRRLLRRMLRLLYMGAAGGQTGADGMSVIGPVYNPALMADFGMVKYYNYSCVVGNKLFSSRRRFLLWEVCECVFVCVRESNCVCVCVFVCVRVCECAK